MNPKRKTSQSRSFSVKTSKEKQDTHASMQKLRIESNNIFSKKSHEQSHHYNEFSKQHLVKKVEPNQELYLKLQYNKLPSKEHSKEIQKSEQLRINLNKIDGTSDKIMLNVQNHKNKQQSKSSRPKSSRRNLLNLGTQNFTLPSSDVFQFDGKSKVKAFWKSQNKFVCLHVSQNVLIQQFEHENILKLYGYIKVKNVNHIVVQAEGALSLAQLKSQFGPFQENSIRRILIQITDGLAQLHSRQYYHNNISPDSLFSHRSGKIMIDPVLIQPKWQPPLAFASPKSSKGRVKLTELLQVQLTEQQQKKLNVYYRPPQMLLGCSKTYQKGDVWAMGVLALELIMGTLDNDQNYHPYNIYARRNFKQKKSINKASPEKLVEKVFEKYKNQLCRKIEPQSQKPINSYDSLEEIPIISGKLFSLINQCLNLEQSQRLSLTQVRNHAFLKQVQKN